MDDHAIGVTSGFDLAIDLGIGGDRLLNGLVQDLPHGRVGRQAAGQRRRARLGLDLDRAA